MQAFPDSYAAGVQDPRSSIPEAWTTGETHTYRFALTVADNDAAQGLSYTQTFTWEARNTTLYSQVILSDGPASYWKLDETNGTSAADSAGAVTGTYTSGPALNQVSGVKDANTAVTFDGTNDYLVMGDVHDFAGTTPFSAELWVNRGTGNETYYRKLISKERYTSATNRGGWNLSIVESDHPTDANRFAFGRFDGGSNSSNARGTTVTQAGVWYHVVATYDGTTMRLYVNGALEDTVPSSLLVENNALPLYVGVFGAINVTNQLFHGQMDEVAIYATVLSAQQVAQHYNAGRR